MLRVAGLRDDGDWGWQVQWSYSATESRVPKSRCSVLTDRIHRGSAEVDASSVPFPACVCARAENWSRRYPVRLVSLVVENVHEKGWEKAFPNVNNRKRWLRMEVEVEGEEARGGEDKRANGGWNGFVWFPWHWTGTGTAGYWFGPCGWWRGMAWEQARMMVGSSRKWKWMCAEVLLSGRFPLISWWAALPNWT